jgi:hypothetical protein
MFVNIRGVITGRKGGIIDPAINDGGIRGKSDARNGTVREWLRNYVGISHDDRGIGAIRDDQDDKGDDRGYYNDRFSHIDEV